MEPNQDTRVGTATPPPTDRRQRREDGWARALRYIVNVTYVLLAINVLIFLGLASADYNRRNKEDIAAAAQREREAQGVSIPQQPIPVESTPAESAGRSDYFKVYLPILGVGLAIGVAGMLMHRKRTRRRSDRNYRGQLLCIVLSVVGLLLYFVFP